METGYYKVKVYGDGGFVVRTDSFNDAANAYRTAEVLSARGSLHTDDYGWVTVSCVSVFSCIADQCVDVADYES